MSRPQGQHLAASLSGDDHSRRNCTRVGIALPPRALDRRLSRTSQTLSIAQEPRAWEPALRVPRRLRVYTPRGDATTAAALPSGAVVAEIGAVMVFVVSRLRRLLCCDEGRTVCHTSFLSTKVLLLHQQASPTIETSLLGGP